MAVTIAELVTKLREAKLCRADWRAYAEHGGPDAWATLEPCLVPVVGELARTYPAPGTGIRLVVRRDGERFLGIAVGDDAFDADDIPLTEADVQALALDPGRVAALVAEVGGGGVAMSPAEQMLARVEQGIEAVRSERLEDRETIAQQRETIRDMAEGPEKFLAGLAAKLEPEERDLFLLLTGKVQDGAVRRVKTFGEIGAALGGITKQAVSSRVKKLYARERGLRGYVESIRSPEGARNFSEVGATTRRKIGAPESYGYEDS